MLFVYLRDEVEVHVDRILTGKVRSIFVILHVYTVKKKQTEYRKNVHFNATQLYHYVAEYFVASFHQKLVHCTESPILSERFCSPFVTQYM